ncbi:protein artemis isoform X2 [Nematostella vectensis]|uniref:protein artemis isoform X2 n=1 Tax=Nematostella vectensis TaxID=45351 RepID=UPI00207787CC|nr:protein artemis isoform X2 [Nematostella vectensis]
MSCFRGKLLEYPQVSIDCFDNENLDSYAYFLSHCHRDHMQGLDSATFSDAIKSKKQRIFCSETTRNLLLCDASFSHLEEYLTGIPLDQPFVVTPYDKETNKEEVITVTLFSAGHCVGSVMFLFEGLKGNVLYTGDFRLATGDTKRITVLHCNGRVKDIRSVYIDTTFCLPKMMSIPSRETNDAIFKVIDRWFSQGAEHVVSLQCKSKYGYEYMLKSIAIYYKIKIHVSDERLEMYRYLSDMIQHFTTDASKTRIHACHWKNSDSSTLPCGLVLPNGLEPKVLRIRPSTFWFAQRPQPLPADNIKYCKEQKMWRVVHSMHASMEEIRDLVGYLRPEHVHPNVEPGGLYTMDDAKKWLSDLTRGDPGDEKDIDDAFRTLCSAGKKKRCKKAPSASVTDFFRELGLEDDDVPVAPLPPKRRRRTKTPDANPARPSEGKETRAGKPVSSLEGRETPCASPSRLVKEEKSPSCYPPEKEGIQDIYKDGQVEKDDQRTINEGKSDSESDSPAQEENDDEKTNIRFGEERRELACPGGDKMESTAQVIVDCLSTVKVTNLSSVQDVTSHEKQSSGVVAAETAPQYGDLLMSDREDNRSVAVKTDKGNYREESKRILSVAQETRVPSIDSIERVEEDSASYREHVTEKTPQVCIESGEGDAAHKSESVYESIEDNSQHNNRLRSVPRLGNTFESARRDRRDVGEGGCHIAESSTMHAEESDVKVGQGNELPVVEHFLGGRNSCKTSSVQLTDSKPRGSSVAIINQPIKVPDVNAPGIAIVCQTSSGHQTDSKPRGDDVSLHRQGDHLAGLVSAGEVRSPGCSPEDVLAVPASPGLVPPSSGALTDLYQRLHAGENIAAKSMSFR